jgi:hypothetical protein
MTGLALNLANRGFDDLVEAARSRLPALAPGWTDYNIHDPGITLVELLAWTAEAQIYSLARMRRDERAAYARWLGVRLTGRQPASGVIWPDPSDPRSPLRSGTRPIVLPATAAIRPEDTDGPVYHGVHDVLLVPGRIVALTTRLADGRRVDRTATNERAAVGYAPFGPDAGPRDRLLLNYECHHEDGLAGWPAGARLLLGVRVAADDPSRPQSHVRHLQAPLEFRLTVAGERRELQVLEDTTCGWLRSGWIALQSPGGLPRASRFALELRAPRGFARAPAVLQVALGVIPVRQFQRIERETHPATGLPGQIVELNERGLRTDDASGRPVESPMVEVQEAGSLATWSAVDDLHEAGPGDSVYVLDRDRGALRFGNGINGRIPGGRIHVSYTVCDGAAGNQARPRTWQAEGLGYLGRNPDAFTGGADSLQLDEARGRARRAARQEHPLVSAQDITAAALALTELQVARALAVPAGAAEPGTVLLVLLQQRTDDAAPTSESPRWLEAVRGALLPRLPLGVRLVVRAPRYLDFGLRASLTAAPGRSPDAISAAALAALRNRLDPMPRPQAQPRPLGEPLTARDLAAWLRSVDGVTHVRELELRDARGRVVGRIGSGRFDLPRFQAASIQLQVARPDARGRA